MAGPRARPPGGSRKWNLVSDSTKGQVIENHLKGSGPGPLLT